MISIIFLLPQPIYSIKRALKLQAKTGNAALSGNATVTVLSVASNILSLKKYVSCFFDISLFVSQTELSRNFFKKFFLI